MALPKFILKPVTIMWSVALGILCILAALAAISLLGTKASGKFILVAPQQPTGTAHPKPASPSTPTASDPPKNSQ